jgi:hypothetical protein
MGAPYVRIVAGVFIVEVMRQPTSGGDGIPVVAFVAAISPGRRE